MLTNTQIFFDNRLYYMETDYDHAWYLDHNISNL